MTEPKFISMNSQYRLVTRMLCIFAQIYKRKLPKTLCDNTTENI